MEDSELKAFCRSVGIQIKDEWDRARVTHAIALAMYDASAAKVASK